MQNESLRNGRNSSNSVNYGHEMSNGNGPVVAQHSNMNHRADTATTNNGMAAALNSFNASNNNQMAQ